MAITFVRIPDNEEWIAFAGRIAPGLYAPEPVED
jgi:hypothetical protein